MKIIITMAGMGSRFKNLGYTLPKHEITVHKKTLFSWSMKSLEELYNEEFIFIIRQEIYSQDFLVKELYNLGITNYKFIIIDYNTEGQASTAILADQYINTTDEVLIYNIDTYVSNGICKSDFSNVDGLWHVFTAPGDKWSFASVDSNQRITDVTEKIRISDYCSIGSYFFKNWKMFKDVYIKYKNDVKKLYRETYIAPFYKYLLKDSSIYVKELNSDDVNILGTPEDLIIFYEKNKGEYND